MLALIVLLSSWAISDRVEAIVGDFPILRSDVIARMVESPDYGSDPGADSALFASTLDGIVDERLLVEGARAAGFFPSAQSISEMVESRMVETRAGFATEEQYLAALAAAGLTEERLRSDLTALMGDQKAASDFVNSRTSRDMASLPADPVRYLNSNLPLLEEELMPRNLSWILIPVLPGGPTRIPPLHSSAVWRHGSVPERASGNWPPCTRRIPAPRPPAALWEPSLPAT